MTVQSAVQVLLSWVVLGSATGLVLAIFSIFFSVEQYTLANLCLCLLTLIFALKTVQLGVIHWDNQMAAPSVFIACGLLGLVLITCLRGMSRYVEGKARALRSASVNQVPLAAPPERSDSAAEKEKLLGAAKPRWHIAVAPVQKPSVSPATPPLSSIQNSPPLSPIQNNGGIVNQGGNVFNPQIFNTFSGALPPPMTWKVDYESEREIFPPLMQVEMYRQKSIPLPPNKRVFYATVTITTTGPFTLASFFVTADRPITQDRFSLPENNSATHNATSLDGKSVVVSITFPSVLPSGSVSFGIYAADGQPFSILAAGPYSPQ